MPSLRYLLLLAAFGCVSEPNLKGPLPVRNQHPAQLTVLHMDPMRGSALPVGQVRLRPDATYSSLFLGGAGGNGNTFQMDGEILRLGVKGRMGLGHNLELRTELAVAHTTGGFLDGFISDWHQAFGLPDHNRGSAPQNRWRVRATQGGETVYEMTEESLELLDLPLELSWSFLPVTEERPFGLGLRGAVEFPTGNSDRGFGSGELEAAIGLVGEYRSPILAITGHVSHTLAGTPDRAQREGFEFSDVTSIGLEGELQLSDTFAFLLQTEFESSTLRGLDFARAADPQWLIWGALRTHFSRRISLDVGVGEDLSGFTSPDVSFYVGMTFDLGGPDP